MGRDKNKGEYLARSMPTDGNEADWFTDRADEIAEGVSQEDYDKYFGDVSVSLGTEKLQVDNNQAYLDDFDDENELSSNNMNLSDYIESPDDFERLKIEIDSLHNEVGRLHKMIDSLLHRVINIEEVKKIHDAPIKVYVKTAYFGKDGVITGELDD